MKQQSKGIFRRLLVFFHGLRLKMLVVFVGSLFSGGAFIITPIYIGKGIDQIVAQVQAAKEAGTGLTADLTPLLTILGILTVLNLLSFAGGYVQEYLVAGIAETVSLNMRNAMSEKLHRLPLRFYDSTEKGEILSRTTSDIEKVAESLRQGVSQLLSAFVRVTVSVSMLIVISPQLSLVAFSTIGLATIGTIFVARYSQKAFLKNQETLGKLNGNIEEAFTGHLIIKAFNQEQQALGRFQTINDQLCKDSRNAEIFQHSIAPLVRITNSFGYIAIAVLSGFALMQGRMSLGTVQMFIQYTDKASEPIIQCANIVNMMQSAIAAAKRFFEILDQPEEAPDTATPVPVREPQGRVELAHVRFGYNPDEPLMRDICLHVDPGHKVAIVGHTGAGKTTLVNLLMRFYDIQDGYILIDGIETHRMTRAQLRGLFGMVLQDAWLFGGTIRDNIAYGKPDATDEEIIAAAKSARADHFIRTLPEGYQTMLEEDGSNVSQGQRQLLTIARALLADPAILILDEATSSVDTRTEKEIQKAMHNLMKGRTSFIIAHKLSTIRDADLILVMEKGNIIEQGTHEQLLAAQGAYARLYQSQFA